MSSFLLTEIALDLLGNKFYTSDGQHARNLQTLYKLSGNELPTGEPTLQTLLCISETSLRAADNLQSDVIVLDDEEEKGTIEVTKQSDETLPSPLHKNLYKITKGKSRKSKIRMKKSYPTSQERHEKPIPSNTSIKGPDQCFELKFDSELHIGDVNQRLLQIVQACNKEYAQMKEESNTEKANFLQLHVASSGEEENMKAYYRQEKENLLKENKILMDFLKLIRNDPTYPKDVLSIVESDILKAKDLIF